MDIHEVGEVILDTTLDVVIVIFDVFHESMNYRVVVNGNAYSA